jgi:hypothetical protein
LESFQAGSWVAIAAMPIGEASDSIILLNCSRRTPFGGPGPTRYRRRSRPGLTGATVGPRLPIFRVMLF